MVLARVGNVKSGWKSMFMVFTTAASDEAPTIVRLAFETVEKIVREHFQHITETETTTFTDCVRGPPHSLCPAQFLDFLATFLCSERALLLDLGCRSDSDKTQCSCR
jgi:Domain of unknown function (DUF1981)